MIHHREGAFPHIRRTLGQKLLEAPEVRVPEWQSLPVADKPQGITHELENVVFTSPIPQDCDLEEMPKLIGANMPWAEEHFQERVSRIPHNPPLSAKNWPFAQSGHKDHTKDEKFSHTYPERFWPKEAYDGEANPGGFTGESPYYGMPGIRFKYGDLDDVVHQLQKSPMTRQAYLPVWFPEDTGAVHGERVPCSLGYHFRIRQGQLHVTYFIRSVDFLRHFPDDVYMAMRLAQWVQDEVCQALHPEYQPSIGNLTMHMVSLHVFGGDMPKMRREYGEK